MKQSDTHAAKRERVQDCQPHDCIADILVRQNEGLRHEVDVLTLERFTTDAPATAALVRFEQERDRADRLEYAAGTYMGENLLLKDKIFELESQLSALQADAQRLDYMIAEECQMWEVNGRYSVHAVTEHHPITKEFSTAREAIDAAIRALKG